ncbi:MAG: protein-glutamate O-methyltransferase [Planctomycetes bacterium]|nr:protein-glutamate O-methyltransferase [Planctomycetota bacterium]
MSGTSAITFPQLTAAAFDRIAALIRSACGIVLADGKQSLVQSRLQMRARELGCATFDDYVDFVESDPSGHERARLIDKLTTNKTLFFREEAHFEYLRDIIVPECRAIGSEISVWCAGCSTGEEPLTFGMCLADTGLDLRLLATDISPSVLEHARRGIYEARAVENVPQRLLSRFFVRLPDGRFGVDQALRDRITYAALNLMNPWPMRGPFDVISCRNVMIYFDRETQDALVRRFRELLRPGGHLLVGHSESFKAETLGLRQVRAATYVRN